MQDKTKYLESLKALKDQIEQLIASEEPQNFADSVAGQPESTFEPPTQRQIMDDPIHKAFDAAMAKKAALVGNLFKSPKK